MWPKPCLPLERVHMDLAGPVWGNKNFLVLVDAYSHFPWVYVLTSITSATIIDRLKEIFSTFGAPNTIVSDNGRQLISSEMECYLAEEGIKHITSPPYHPSSNGLAERFIRTMKVGVNKLLEEGKDLKTALRIILREYRASPHPDFDNQSPAYLFFHREMRSPVDCIKFKRSNLLGSKDEKIPVDKPERNDPPLPPSSTDNSPLYEIDKHRLKEFKLGEAIWFRNYAGKPKWLPGKIKDRVGVAVYKIEEEHSGTIHSRHTDQLKPRRIGLRDQ